ncbi:U2AF65-like splicing factor [Trypanosoma theileri]|uniref:U2AF65-like splicing factor n=1 Tax=Trypanosoma theileri TaxID=67003 RepID=A0A1X0PA55_9TRYP|nr:U2AF65-like splicing factor [Trypanosoma theileri]ORC93340.1 U2AF65-like splicing factor [Trypanosoma theileri]
MGRDSRGDRYSRRNDTSDRHGIPEGPSGNSSTAATAASTRYGRYAGNRRSRSPRGSRRGGSDERNSERHRRRRRSASDERQRRRPATSRRAPSKETGRRGHRRSRSRSSSSSSTSRKGELARSRFEEVNVQELLNPGIQTIPGGMGAPVSPDVLFALLKQQQEQLQHEQELQELHAAVEQDYLAQAQAQAQAQAVLGSGNETQVFQETSNTTGYTEQEPQQIEEQPAENEENGEIPTQPTAPVKVLPSVADFVPVIPKSLLNLLGVPPSKNDTSGGETKNDSAAEGGQNDNGQEGVLTTTTGALAVLQAPKLSPEAERRAREARRAHISCFPQHTSRQDLLDYFTTIIPMVRRVKVQREMDQLAESMGGENNNGGVIDEGERRVIPSNAVVDVDRVIDLSVNSAKSKPFAFLEVNLADLVTELVEESQRDPERFTFIAADGQSYPITIRRPRDYQSLPGVDHRKVVMLGFPASLSAEKLRMVFEQFGSILAFDVKAGMAYAEFERESDAVDCVRDLHGETLGTHVVVLLPLYDWLKVVCTHAGIDVTLDPDDPVSGASLLAKDAQSTGALVPLLAEDLAKADEPVDHMKELVGLTVPLPDVVLHFAKTFPHLTTLYGSSVPIFPTRVLVLLNLFDEEELVLDETYERLLDEISSEVEKYGRVKSLIVPRRTPPPIPPKPPKNLYSSRMRTTKKSTTASGRDRGRQNQSKKKGGENEDELDMPVPTHSNTSGGETSENNATNGMTTFGKVNDRGGSIGDSNEESEDSDNDDEARYEREKAEYLKAREAYTDKLMHPIHGGFGRVFVEYETIDEAAEAQRAIVGRLFGGRTVVTSFMFEDVLYPPTAEEEEMQAEEKVKLYLEAVGAEEEEETKAQQEGKTSVNGDNDKNDASDEAQAVLTQDEEKEEVSGGGGLDALN